MTPQVLYIPTTMHKGGVSQMAGQAGKKTGGGDGGPEVSLLVSNAGDLVTALGVRMRFA